MSSCHTTNFYFYPNLRSNPKINQHFNRTNEFSCTVNSGFINLIDINLCFNLAVSLSTLLEPTECNLKTPIALRYSWLYGCHFICFSHRMRSKTTMAFEINQLIYFYVCYLHTYTFLSIYISVILSLYLPAGLFI